MSEFKVKCSYIGVKKKKFFRDQEPAEYHQFLVENPEKIPCQYFSPLTRLGKGDFNPQNLIIECSIFISANLIKKMDLDFKYKQYYQFIMNLGEPKTADFTIYYNIPPLGGQYEEHSMVLKTKDYFENTIKKIGFWDSGNYFYESNQKPERPTKRQNNNPTKTENKTD
jgi:hypothetical protein